MGAGSARKCALCCCPPLPSSTPSSTHTPSSSSSHPPLLSPSNSQQQQQWDPPGLLPPWADPPQYCCVLLGREGRGLWHTCPCESTTTTEAQPGLCCFFLDTKWSSPVVGMMLHGDHGSAWRRRQRRLGSWWRHEQQSVAMALSAAVHHSFDKVAADAKYSGLRHRRRTGQRLRTTLYGDRSPAQPKGRCSASCTR